VLVMLNHLAMLGRPEIRIQDWLTRRAPWFDDKAIIAKLLKRPTMWKADTLGKRLNLTDAERTRLKIRTIGAADRPKHLRTAERSEKIRLAKEAKRRAAGATARVLSLAQLQPWKNEGISRRTWFRRRRGTNSGTVYLFPLYC
jgi:hypothetical protein